MAHVRMMRKQDRTPTAIKMPVEFHGEVGAGRVLERSSGCDVEGAPFSLRWRTSGILECEKIEMERSETKRVNTYLGLTLMR